jgi:hypothetical protein
MYHVHVENQDPQKVDSKTSDTIYPLSCVLLKSTGMEDIATSIIFALQGREIDGKYAAGRDAIEGEKGVVVFRFLKIQD